MPLPEAPVGSPLHAACAAHRPNALPSPGPHLARCICFVSTRQGAKTFNQSLSFNTSSVTDMSFMFRVSSARAPASTRVRLARFSSVPGPWEIGRPCLLARPSPLVYYSSARQNTYDPSKKSGFNQPLSFDTSSVTDMSYMFIVRSARALPPVSSLRLLARYLTPHVAPHPPVSGARLALHPGLFTCSPLTRQRASAFDQPLSLNTSSVTDMSYMFGVRSARALPPVSSLRLLAR